MEMVNPQKEFSILSKINLIKKANRLITFSGLDGAGKTTVINQLLAIINNRGDKGQPWRIPTSCG